MAKIISFLIRFIDTINVQLTRCARNVHFDHFRRSFEYSFQRWNYQSIFFKHLYTCEHWIIPFNYFTDIVAVQLSTMHCNLVAYVDALTLTIRIN